MASYPEIPESEFYGRTWDERQAFLRAASECPEIRLADALREIVYIVVLKTPAEHYTDQFSQAAITWRAELDWAMQNWARSFNLADAEWVIPAAWDAINTWQCLPDRRNSNPFTSVRLYAPTPQFNWPIWAADTSERDYRRLAESEFSRVLEDYILANRQAREKDPPLTLREAKNPVELRYTWAALRVCRRWPYRQIAEHYGSSESITEEAVRKMVVSICQRIGIPLERT